MSLRRSAADFALPALRRRVDSFVFIREEPEEGLDICDTDADRDDFGSTVGGERELEFPESGSPDELPFPEFDEGSDDVFDAPALVRW